MCPPNRVKVIANSDETWLIQLDESLTSALATLPASISDEISDQYSLSFDEIELLETVLRPLAADALTQGKTLCEWISL
jgi:hypothetical protein